VLGIVIGVIVGLGAVVFYEPPLLGACMLLEDIGG
jgi:hypothetical protein